MSTTEAHAQTGIQADVAAGTGIVQVPERADFSPSIGYAILLGLATLYAPPLLDAAHVWLHNENYTHGFLIFPISAFLVWNRRRAIAQAPRLVQPWGIALIVLAVAIQVFSYLIVINHGALWSLVIALHGAVLTLYGREVHKKIAFPISFLLFAVPFPTDWISSIALWIKAKSMTGAVWLVTSLGYLVLQHGNFIEVPRMNVEMAQACSGYNELIAILAIAVLYGQLCTANRVKRLVLAISAVPVAICANIARVSLLVIAGSSGGPQLYNRVHEPIDIIGVFIAFLLILGIGTLLKCEDQPF